MKLLLIEIGSEEIPARFVQLGVSLLKDELTSFLHKENIYYKKDTIREFSTPRRLALLFDVQEKQEDTGLEQLGPSKKAAFDPDGNPTKAAAGFARSLGIEVGDLTIKNTDKGDYVSAVVEKKGRPTKEVLSEILPQIISSLKLPKSMRWGESSLRYFRPILWIVATLDNEVIPFELDRIKSGNVTYGHRFLSPAVTKVVETEGYLALLRQNHVIADPVERKNAVSEGIRKIESSLNCRAIDDEELLDTVTNLVEHPTAVLGNFEEKYLSLPKELLITVMKSHQKYFSVENKKGELLPGFILISNTVPENNDTVRRGAERVLKARLEDAKFYFNEDQKRPLWDYIEKLKDVTFQETLGSVYEKVERVAFICSFLADVLNLPTKEKILRAVMLSKADLVTGIVREFPELQGYTGMIYAKNSGEDDETASAIYEHYKPRFSGDALPSNEIGTIISLADKMDNIVSFFFVGLTPTGSEDPFALRRQAIGVINILMNKDYNFSLDVLIDRALQGVESYLPARKSLNTEILKFFYQRLEGMFSSEGYSYDLVNSVLSSQGPLPPGKQKIKGIKNRIKFLSLMKKESEFLELLTAAKRVYNILSKIETVEVKEALLIEAAEKDLFSVAREVKDKLTMTDYKALFELKDPINTFFDNVLVMDKKPEIRRNRLGLLFSVKRIFDSLGDFSMISE